MYRLSRIGHRCGVVRVHTGVVIAKHLVWRQVVGVDDRLQVRREMRKKKQYDDIHRLPIILSWLAVMHCIRIGIRVRVERIVLVGLVVVCLLEA